jgi:hypothetical protein
MATKVTVRLRAGVGAVLPDNRSMVQGSPQITIGLSKLSPAALDGWSM